MADEDNKNGATTPIDRLTSEDTLTEAELKAREPANIGAATGAKLEASGAFIEDGAKKQVDVSHPAVDNNPRADTSIRQNQIDFNDPGLKDDEAVAQNLGLDTSGE